MSREMLDAYRDQVVDQQNVLEAYKIQIEELQRTMLTATRWRNVWCTAFIVTFLYHLCA